MKEAHLQEGAAFLQALLVFGLSWLPVFAQLNATVCNCMQLQATVCKWKRHFYLSAPVAQIKRQMEATICIEEAYKVCIGV